MADATNAQVEEFLRGSALKFRRHPEREDIWELGFGMRANRFTVFIDNGVSNPRFLSVNVLYMKPQVNHKEFYRQLLRKTGSIVFGKFVLDDKGNVSIRACIPRDAALSPLEGLRPIMGAVLQAADQWYLELLNLAMQSAS